MKGKIVIKVTDKGISVNGRLTNANILSHARIIDALMCAFELTGEKRTAVCQALIDAERKKSEEKAKEA